MLWLATDQSSSPERTLSLVSHTRSALPSLAMIFFDPTRATVPSANVLSSAYSFPINLELETLVPQMRQQLSTQLSDVEVSQNPTHYPRAPDKPLQFNRLLLLVARKRPPIMRWDMLLEDYCQSAGTTITVHTSTVLVPGKMSIHVNFRKYVEQFKGF